MNWTELERGCLSCRKCSLCEKRKNVVFGVGSHDAEIMLIGEGPGEQEDLLGEPFVGRAGILLDDMLEMIGLRRDGVYIANIVKCRPPGNRDPLNTEREACSPWLEAQIGLINPKIIVCLGRIAATALIDENFKITREHGKWLEKDGRNYIALYHPAALLRDHTKRPETFVDLKTLQRKIRAVCDHTL